MSYQQYHIKYCLFVCPIITREPFTDLPQILIGELGKTMGMFLAWLLKSKLSRFTLVGSMVSKLV